MDNNSPSTFLKMDNACLAIKFLVKIRWKLGAYYLGFYPILTGFIVTWLTLPFQECWRTISIFFIYVFVRSDGIVIVGALQERDRPQFTQVQVVSDMLVQGLTLKLTLRSNGI